jgi:hypothetical protein
MTDPDNRLPPGSGLGVAIILTIALWAAVAAAWWWL